MAKIVKLENINAIKGTRQEQYVEEYVCSNCRHLINPDDKTCWQCGERLEQSSLIEHYHRGERLAEGEFQKRKKL